MVYILHRKLNQPRSGRRLLQLRRSHERLHDPDRRGGEERRVLVDRRKANQ